MADEKKPLADAVADVKETVKETATETVSAIVDEIKKDKQELKAEAVAWYDHLPGFGKLLVVVALVVGYIGYEKYVATPAQPVVINVQTTPTNVANATAVDKVTAEKVQAGRLLANILRKQTVKQLQEDGLKSATGDPKPLNKEAATTLISNLEDDDILAVAQLGLPQGKFLDTVADVIHWLIENKDQIKKIVELIILLLSAFA